MTPDIQSGTPARKPWEFHRIRLEGSRKQALETGRNRVLVTGAVFAFAFLAISGRLVDLTVLDGPGEPRVAQSDGDRGGTTERGEVLDRNGIILATSLPTVSLYADASEVLDPTDATDRLLTVLPDLDRAEVITKLSSHGRFIWIRRNLTPSQQFQVNRLGIPGLQFHQSEKRVYPHGRLAAHILGLTDVDGRGIAGIERMYDEHLRTDDAPIRLSIDIRVQAIVQEELASAVNEFQALGGAAIVFDVSDGETLAMVSLPDFDPNQPSTLQGEAGFNRATKGVYEMGSTFKLFTAAMALDSGTVTMQGGYDASKPIRIARFTINDDHAKKRWLSVPEIVTYSSNIGAAKMAMDVGTATQRDYLGRLGLLTAPTIEIPEVGKPLVPATWRDINTMTIAYGHGIAVSPVQLAAATATLVNGGIRYAPTLLHRDAGSPLVGERVLSTDTSRKMRELMELVVDQGTGKQAKTAGYRIGGKTGSAEKEANGKYRVHALISSFVGAFPIERPRYVVLVVLDEPHGNKRTYNYATGGWVAAPAVGRIVKRIAPLEGIMPNTPDNGSVPAAAPETTPRRAPRNEPANRDLVVAVRAALDDVREARRAAQ